MILNSFYLSDKNNLQKAIDITGLSIDELESVVGYFTKRSWREGQMKGEVVEKINGDIIIRHHFTKKVLWKMEGYTK